MENARTDWLWKADQAQTTDTLPDVNGITRFVNVANDVIWPLG